MYCTYLTIYDGKKLPHFYIGSSSITKIENGYHGSVSSIKYGDIWKQELKENPELFKTHIISTHESRQEALDHERFLQESLNVVKSPDYINVSLAAKNGFFGRDVSLEEIIHALGL